LNGHKEIVELLIAAGENVNEMMTDETPLDLAIRANHPETADLLRKHGGKSGAEFSIHIAAAMGNIEAVKQHLDAGTDANVQSWNGWIPLHFAAQWDQKETAELLIANGAGVNARGKRGNTPLDVAIRFPWTKTLDLLREHGGKTGEELKALMPHLVQHGRGGFSFVAKKGKVYEVQDLFDLLNWEAIKTYTGTGASVRFDEERDHDPPKIFYRVKLVD
jgi:ankyrin repeat protein